MVTMINLNPVDSIIVCRRIGRSLVLEFGNVRRHLGITSPIDGRITGTADINKMLNRFFMMKLWFTLVTGKLEYTPIILFIIDRRTLSLGQWLLFLRLNRQLCKAGRQSVRR